MARPSACGQLAACGQLILIYVLHGEDSFSAHEALGVLLDAMGPDDVREPNLSGIEAGGFSAETLAAAAMVMPFLADRRVVVVRGLMATAERQQRRTTRARDTQPAKVPQGLTDVLAQLPPTSDVVFLEAKLTPANPIFKAVTALGNEQVKAREFPAIKGAALTDWVNDRAAKKEAHLDRRAAAMLADMVGPNLWAMDSEIEKLAIYRNGEVISTDDVLALVSSAKETSVFELVDALMARRVDVALSAMQRLLEDGATGQYLLSMVARQVRMIAIAQDLAARQVPRQEWAPRLGTSSDFVVRKTTDQARQFPPDAVRALYRLLLETDIAMKTGTTDDLAMTEMITRAAALRGPARRV